MARSKATTNKKMYDIILDAAEAVVCESGSAHLTLDAVYTKAGISKGGLLYHFHNKKELIQAMLERLVQNVLVVTKEKALGLPATPAQGIKSLILVTESVLDSGNIRGLTAGWMAAVANDPAMSTPQSEFRAELVSFMCAGGISKTFASTILFALEGLWTMESLNITCLNRKERKNILNQILTLVEAEERQA